MDTTNSIKTKIRKFLLLTGLLFLILPEISAQEYFEGSVTYGISLTGKYAADLLANEPAKKMDLHVKDDNFIISLYEARIPRTFLFIGDSNQTYIVDMGAKTYYLRDYYVDTSEVVPVAEKVRDSVQVKDIWCEVYRVVKPGEAAILYYVSDDYRVNTANFEDKDDAKADFLTAGLDGRIPLRKVIKQRDLTITTEFTSIKRRELNPGNFMIPPGLTRKKRDPRK